MNSFYDFEAIATILDDIVDSLPQELLNDLNGIYLEPELKHNDKIPSEQYYVLGTYFQRPYLGSWIELYYGSIVKLYGFADRTTLINELTKVVKHEIRHHIETKAGCDDLIKSDDEFVAQALEKLKQEKETS